MNAASEIVTNTGETVKVLKSVALTTETDPHEDKDGVLWKQFKVAAVIAWTDTGRVFRVQESTKCWVEL